MFFAEKPTFTTPKGKYIAKLGPYPMQRYPVARSNPESTKGDGTAMCLLPTITTHTTTPSRIRVTPILRVGFSTYAAKWPPTISVYLDLTAQIMFTHKYITTRYLYIGNNATDNNSTAGGQE